MSILQLDMLNAYFMHINVIDIFNTYCPERIARSYGDAGE